MKIYNTATRRKEDFKPLNEGKVSVYVCGPTVYNLIHLGNARPIVVFDAVRRFLEYRGCDVDYVMNYTDVNEKIAKKAAAEGRTELETAEHYISELHIDLEGLNIKPIELTPRVSEHINEIIELIQTLIDKGFAYNADDTVFFSVEADKGYGRLSGKRTEELEAGARVEINERKRSPFDFVLWEPAKDGEASWDSPFGSGRPGWHIECSAMVRKHLGETIDIHCAGEDLIFPHNENEAAQSECAFDAPLANYWMHNAMVMIDDEKMSKSLGNFFLLREAASIWGYDVIRFFILSAHYRSPINFGEEALTAAKNGLERIRNCAEKLSVSTGSEAVEGLEVYRQQFEAAMEDDFNTANAITAIFELVKFANINATINNSKTLLKELSDLYKLLGFEFKIEEDINAVIHINQLIAERNEAKREKDYARADEIKNLIREMGYELKDTREGKTIWSKKT